MMTHEDKERDDALIAEKKRLAEQLQIFAYGLGSSPSASMMLQAAAILRGDEQPKPDRAEVLARDVLLAWSGYQQLTDEEARSEDFAKACRFTQTALDELRAEWEAERPAVVVPMSAKMWAESVLNLRGAINATCEREAARFILSLDGAKGDE